MAVGDEEAGSSVFGTIPGTTYQFNGQIMARTGGGEEMPS